MPIDGSRRKTMLLPMITVLLLAIAWSGYWLMGSVLGKRVVAAKRAELQQDGVSLVCRNEGWGGYPFRFEFDCDSPVLAFRDGAELASGRMRAVTMAYNPWHVLVLVDGPTTLSTPVLGQTPIEHGRAVISLTFGDDDVPDLSAEVLNPVIPDIFMADRLMFHTRPASRGTDIALSIDDVRYRSKDGPEFRVDRGELVGTLLLPNELSIQKLDLQHDKVRVWGEGKLFLDPERRIAGRLSTQTNDLAEFFVIVEPHLNLTDQQKTNMHTVLGLLGNTPKTDLVAQQGQLFLGPFKVATLTPLY